eukprot:CAMPEP_0194315644 /NCGR_PEP_ID=MMETSP0171-20130528/12433_1 /TAXON_ID=218684 /ORGANISM="Corethron pennatum, Strain L29A3" /LENGTH=186 /DNA_ID=CAMNT_0039071535 /DNA_START=648 /DNA_END=1208 /DNA_ORIENTATION=-
MVDTTIMAKILDAEIFETEWLVTGRVNPAYFSDKFEFREHGMELEGIENYARFVHNLYDQATVRAEVVSTLPCPDHADQITCTWRLSGTLDNGDPIKAQICRTIFTIDTYGIGLITYQETVSEVSEWDMLLSSFMPFLNGTITAGDAPPVPTRKPPVNPLKKDRFGTLLANVQSSFSLLYTGALCV